MQTVIDLGDVRRRKQAGSMSLVEIDHEGQTITVMLGLRRLADESQAAFLRRFALTGHAVTADGKPMFEMLATMDDTDVAHMIASIAVQLGRDHHGN
jgi:hypothetical protein